VRGEGVFQPEAIMSRTLLALMAVAFAAPLFAQEPKKEPALKVGDPAPPLAVDKWLVGKGVKGFEKGTVYVVSFTSLNSPDFPAGVVALSDLHDAGKVVAVGVVPSFGLTADDRAREFEWRAGVLKATGASHPFAWDVGGKTADAYAGQAGVGTAFVIDQAGKVAFVGTDVAAAHVAPKVLDGTWKGKADADAMTAAMDTLVKLSTELRKKLGPPSGEPADELLLKKVQGELSDVEKVFKDHPFLHTAEGGWQTRLVLHLSAQSRDVPAEMIAARLAAAKKRNYPTVLRDLAFMLASAPFKPDPKLAEPVAELADWYAERLDPKAATTDEYDEWTTLIVLTSRYGKTEKASAYTKTVLDAAPADQRKEMEAAIKRRLKDAGVGDK
jgi:hypothetical protein